MQRKNCSRRLAAFTFLGFMLAVLVRPAAAQEATTFAVFEVVDCKAPGARSMVLKGTEENHCLASKPIIDQTHLKMASRRTTSDGEPQLRLDLTESGGKLMQKETERIIRKHQVDHSRGKLAIVIRGELLHVPTLVGVLKDEIFLGGKRLKQEEIDDLVHFLETKAVRQNQA